MPIHLMIDLETMGRTTTAAPVSLGAVAFDPTGELKPLDQLSEATEKFYIRIRLQSSLAWGLTLDPDTIAWWFRQNDPARLEVASAIETGVELKSALMSFREWLYGARPVRYWSHGASFDMPILDHAFRAISVHPPWQYPLIRDTRTLFDLAGMKYKTADRDGHNALTDAWNQARAVQEAYRRLGLREVD